MSVGSDSMLTSRVTCSSTPPSMAPGASSPPMSSRRDDRVDGHVEAHAQEVDVHRVPAHRVALGVLEHGRGGLAVELELDHGAARGERVAQLALVDGERQRVLAAAVEDAGHLALAAQAAGGARVGDLARGDGELGGLTGHGRRRMVAPRRSRRRQAPPRWASGARRPRPPPRGSPRAGRRRPAWRRSRASRPPTASPSRRPARAACAERSGSDGIECSHSRTRASSTPCARAASRMVSSSAAVPFVQPA